MLRGHPAALCPLGQGMAEVGSSKLLVQPSVIPFWPLNMVGFSTPEEGSKPADPELG